MLDPGLAMSAPRSNKSFWIRVSDLRASGSECNRAKPIAAFVSSISPWAVIRSECLYTRSPLPREVWPVSPPFVYILSILTMFQSLTLTAKFLPILLYSQLRREFHLARFYGMKLPESVSGPLYLAIRRFLCIYTLMVDGIRDDDPTQVRVAWRCTCFNIRRASRAVTQFYDQIMAPSGIKATQFTMLGAVAMMGSPSVTALSQQLNLDRTTLTRNLKVLVKMGLITISIICSVFLIWMDMHSIWFAFFFLF